MTNIDWGIIGHQFQLEAIQSQIAEGTLSHNYLFSGPQQIGKYTIAKKMAARALSDQASQFSENYDRLNKGLLTDVTLMDDLGDSLKINEIRDLVRQTNLTHSSRYRFVIIKNIDRMMVEAQNAFLKTLEEHEENTIFIMTTSNISKVLPTILSRVRHYRFSTVNPAEIKVQLSKDYTHQLTDEMLSQSHGKPGLLIDWLQNPDLYIKWQTYYQKIERFFKKESTLDKFLFVDELLKDDKDTFLFLNVFTYFVSELAHQKIDKVTNSKKVVNLFDVLQKTRYFMGRNVNKKLALENLLLQTEK